MKLRNSRLLAVLLLSALSLNIQAQDDLMDLLDDDSESSSEPVNSAFKGTRLILGHSTKTRKAGELELLISHRFGRINSGSHNLWGLDNSSVRIGFDYGLTDNFDIGIGRSSIDKSFDGFMKYKVVEQTEDDKKPISIALFTSMAIRTTPREEDDPSYQFKERLAYTYQAIISRKFSPSFTMQVSPTYLVRNRPNDLTDEDGLMAVGIGGRLKVSGSVTVNLETYPRINAEDNTTEFNSVAVGVDIETGGHVFQLHLTNSQMTFERAFIAETMDDFFDGDIHFGFNISRTFQLKK